MSMEYAQSLISLGLVAALILLVGWGFKKLITYQKKASLGKQAGDIQIFTSHPLDPQRQISLIGYESRRFLVVIGKDHETLLGQWDENTALDTSTDIMTNSQDHAGGKINEPNL